MNTTTLPDSLSGSQPAVVLAHERFAKINGKTAHGLIRGSDRFRVMAVIDRDTAGGDAGLIVDGKKRGIPICASLEEAISQSKERPRFCIVGIATHGGRIPEEFLPVFHSALDHGLSLVNGLHDFISDIPELANKARERGLQIIDIRKPKQRKDMHFWSGEILKLKTPRIAILGTDCAIGKRTTTRILMQELNRHGCRSEMIYTGQTGWMQGSEYGFIFDTTPNDFVSGEMENAILRCAENNNPNVILLEGQSALQNPSGPCGAEYIVSARATGVILQVAPGRKYFEGYEELELEIPPLENELQLIRLYGAQVLALVLNNENLTPAQMAEAKQHLETKYHLPSIDLLADGADRLITIVKKHIGTVP